MVVDLVYEDAPATARREMAESLFPLDRDLAITCPSTFIGTINTATCTIISCSAKDLTYLSCELVPVDALGTPLTTQCINCICGDPISVKVELQDPQRHWLGREGGLGDRYARSEGLVSQRPNQ